MVFAFFWCCYSSAPSGESRAKECFSIGCDFALWIRFCREGEQRVKMRVYSNPCHDNARVSGRQKICFFSSQMWNHRRWKIIRCKGERRFQGGKLLTFIHVSWRLLRKQNVRSSWRVGEASTVDSCKTNLILICECTTCFFRILARDGDVFMTKRGKFEEKTMSWRR